MRFLSVCCSLALCSSSISKKLKADYAGRPAADAVLRHTGQSFAGTVGKEPADQLAVGADVYLTDRWR